MSLSCCMLRYFEVISKNKRNVNEDSRNVSSVLKSAQ